MIPEVLEMFKRFAVEVSVAAGIVACLYIALNIVGLVLFIRSL